MSSTSASLSRVLLVSDKRPSSPDMKIRRYRLARLRIDERPSAVDRFSHLKRSHD